jgi:hypothetical protein
VNVDLICAWHPGQRYLCVKDTPQPAILPKGKEIQQMDIKGSESEKS